MTEDHGFTEDQKQYLEAFIVGIATRRGVQSVDAAATSTAANPYPADPMAIHFEAQDLAVAAGGKLAAEEVAKREKHPFNMWDEIAANAAAGRFPKGLDVFRHKFHGLFYVAPNQEAFMLRLRLPGGFFPRIKLGVSPTSPSATAAAMSTLPPGPTYKFARLARRTRSPS
jgi:ferredoxin-nitrite reductase